ncbi:MAG: hypothetical protein AAFR77_18045 [Cyanobacteria bacterium J06631_2]
MFVARLRNVNSASSFIITVLEAIIDIDRSFLNEQLQSQELR